MGVSVPMEADSEARGNASRQTLLEELSSGMHQHPLQHVLGYDGELKF